MNQQPSKRQDEIRFTQNFLRDPVLVEKLIAKADIWSGETVLEIGPGKGIITKALAKAVGTEGQVIAVELDSALATRLTAEFALSSQVKIVAGDILTFDRMLLTADYKVFANVPFNITSALLEYLFDDYASLATAHLILQIETLVAVGERGANLETFKSLLIKPFYTIAIAHRFQRSDFIPPPSVDTALFRFERRTTPLIDPKQYELYKDFLAFISRDRVGEGVWLRVFSRQQIQRLAEQSGIVVGRGLKLQSADAISAAFRLFAEGAKAKQQAVRGAMASLRAEQVRREQINRSGDHRRPRQR